MADPDARLPTVVLTSVVRSAHKGESHGGVYLVDLETSRVEQVLDWNDPGIDWQGRGADRGLRGIAFHGDRVLLAASDEIFVYDRAFRLIGSFANRYLKHCHEMTVQGDTLYVTSTGFDSVLEYDLAAERFRAGYCLRVSPLWRGRRTLGLRPRPSFHAFDPEGDDGPTAQDSSHINNVYVDGDGIFVCGTGLGNVWRVRPNAISRYARVPYGTHNARPFHGGILMNHTATDRIAYADRRGRLLRSFALPEYGQRELVNASLPRDVARPGFGRGLTVADDLIIGGSSPSTVNAYRFATTETVRSVNVTMDVRNAVHGLELWPFARR
jgi:hypothetical protein